MNRNEIKPILKEYNQGQVNNFIEYVTRLDNEKGKDKKPKNQWMRYRTNEWLANQFKKVASQGLVLDGEHVTINVNGISYDYVAYRNKMLMAYPESVIDVGMVYKGDKFEFSKNSGKVYYTHNIADPFGQKEGDIIGGYCVIKNKRGEFLTLLSRDDIEKHRKVAKTDSIWRQWFFEMAMKTVIKKACKQHFQDIYQSIEQTDNENYDLETPTDVTIDEKADIEKITTVDALKEYWGKNRSKCRSIEDFDKMVSKRKREIESENQKETEVA